MGMESDRGPDTTPPLSLFSNVFRKRRRLCSTSDAWQVDSSHMNSSCLAVLRELRQVYHRTRTWGSTSNVCEVLHMGEQLCLLLYILTGPLSGQRLRSFQPCKFHVFVSHLTLGCGPLKASLSSLAGPAPEDSTEKAGGQDSLVSSARTFSLSVHSSVPAAASFLGWPEL